MGVPSQPTAILWATLATLLFAGWQQLTVSRNFAGNWTALFCTGSQQPVPPALREGTYLVSSPTGFDGQMYRYVAHDPFLTGDAHRYLDDPPLRTRRILVPVLAWALALGRQEWIDAAYIVLFFAICFAGTFWPALYLEACGMPQRWSLAFLAIPATLIATDRLVIDMASAALAAGIVWYERSGNRRMLFVTLLLGCLCRETGLIFVAAFAGSAVLNRSLRKAMFFAASALPTLAWYGYVQFRLGKAGWPEWVGKTAEIGPLKWFLHPFPYPFAPLSAGLAQTLDRFAILGMAVAFLLALMMAWKNFRQPLHLAALLFAASGAATLDPLFWNAVHNFARPYSPLMVILALHGAAVPRYRFVWLLPVALMDPRIVFQLTPQILGVFGIRVLS